MKSVASWATPEPAARAETKRSKVGRLWLAWRITQEVVLCAGIALVLSLGRNDSEVLVLCVGVALWLAIDARGRGSGWGHMLALRYTMTRDRALLAHLDLSDQRTSEDRIAEDLAALQYDHTYFSDSLSPDEIKALKTPTTLRQLRIDIEDTLSSSIKTASRHQTDFTIYGIGYCVRWMMVVLYIVNR